MKAVLSRLEASQHLGVSTKTLDRLRACGAIPASQVSRRLVKYRLQDLDTYLLACQTHASSESPLHQTGTSSGSKVDTHAAIQRAREIVARQRRSSLHTV